MSSNSGKISVKRDQQDRGWGDRCPAYRGHWRPTAMIYRFGGTSVDTLRAEIRRGGETVPLRRKSFDVLVYLLQRPRRVVTKAELLDAVWGDRVVTEGSLKSCLTEIRAAIGDHERKLILTVPRRGYMLEAPFEREAPEAYTRTSILVVPIKDQSPDSDSAYVADGLTEEIITELSKIQSGVASCCE